MDPIIGGALINAGGSLLGGLFGKDPPKPSAMVVSHIKGVMDASKRFGINPLTILGSIGGPSEGAAPPNYMGAALADAAMFAADAFLKKGESDALKLNAYQQENQRLQEKLTHVTLNPKVPGIYGGGDGDAGATAGRVYQDQPMAGTGAGGGGGRFGGVALTPLQAVDPSDPRRGVDNRDVQTHAGAMVIDSPWAGKVYVPTLDGDEALDIFDVPSIAIAAPQVFNNWWNRGTGGVSLNPMDWARNARKFGARPAGPGFKPGVHKPKPKKKHDLHSLGF